MKAIYPIVFSVVLVCLVLTGPAWGGTDITREFVHPELFFVIQDPCQRMEVFTPPPPGSKDKFHQDDPEPASIGLVVQRRIAWRVDILHNASYSDFDWKVIRLGLKVKYRVKIGELCDCRVTGELKGPGGCYATYDCYSAYTREHYLVNQNGKIAVISVLTPTDGMIPVPIDVVCGYGTNQIPEPATNGLCASPGPRPFNGDTCRRTGGKDDFKDQPILADPEVPATWGRIKALYE